MRAALLYLFCTLVACTVVTLGAVEVAQAWLHQLGNADTRASAARANAASVRNVRPIALAREARIVPTAERIRGDPEFWTRVRSSRRDERIPRNGHSQVAARSGLSYRPMLHEPGEDDDDEPKPVVTYRTLCVRLCDGYYFPISFSAPQERFAADAAQCQSRCGSDARLFVHRNPDGKVEEMQDLQGRAYAQLPNAFLYRTQYVAACKCRPDPWEPQAKEQHRLYALAAAARKGDARARHELGVLEKTRREAAARPAVIARSGVRDGSTITPPENRPTLERGPGGERRMGLGLSAQRAPQPAPGGTATLPDWARGVFQPN